MLSTRVVIKILEIKYRPKIINLKLKKCVINSNKINVTAPLRNLKKCKKGIRKNLKV